MCAPPCVSKKFTYQFLLDWSVHSKLSIFLQEAVTYASEHLKCNNNDNSSSSNKNNNNSHPQRSVVPKDSDEFKVLGLSFVQKEYISLQQVWVALMSSLFILFKKINKQTQPNQMQSPKNQRKQRSNQKHPQRKIFHFSSSLPFPK